MKHVLYHTLEYFDNCILAHLVSFVILSICQRGLELKIQWRRPGLEGRGAAVPKELCWRVQCGQAPIQQTSLALGAQCLKAHQQESSR